MPRPASFTSFHARFIAFTVPAQDTDLAPLEIAGHPINKEMMMTTHFDQARVELDQALFLRLVNAAGTRIICLEGSLWITRDGCSKDVELSPGQAYLVEDAARVIVTGFGPSQARVSQTAQPRSTALQSLASFVPRWGRRLVAA